LDRHDYSAHLDFAGLVRHAGTANRFVAASSSITRWVDGSKNKAGRPLFGNPNIEIRSSTPPWRERQQARMIEVSMSQTEIPAGDSVSVICALCFGFVDVPALAGSDFVLRISDFGFPRPVGGFRRDW
jgi:hypothetical protein